MDFNVRGLVLQVDTPLCNEEKQIVCRDKLRYISLTNMLERNGKADVWMGVCRQIQ